MIHDSGSRRKFETEAVQDVTERKEKRRKARRRKMIEKIYKNKYMAICDNCGEGQEFNTWTDTLEYMFEEGWRKKLFDGEWKHYCPECQEGLEC